MRGWRSLGEQRKLTGCIARLAAAKPASLQGRLCTATATSAWHGKGFEIPRACFSPRNVLRVLGIVVFSSCFWLKVL